MKWTRLILFSRLNQLINTLRTSWANEKKENITLLLLDVRSNGTIYGSRADLKQRKTFEEFCNSLTIFFSVGNIISILNQTERKMLKPTQPTEKREESMQNTHSEHIIGGLFE